ncbi:MAG: RdgB/HAM1 family non-canonical purine NTP pyrophosphatase [Planctomycetota bacterium]|nr:RdgB/HAM1 family non-canonical purine NTP pyrophosphatase [Planctomycetota bacterium]
MLLVGSQNVHKLQEIRELLHDVPVVVVGSDALPPGPDVEEDGETFSENVRIKALEYARRAAGLQGPERPRWVIADDSGLCVDALSGAPGVRSARYAGESCTYDDNNRKLLEALRGVPVERRSARFVCAIACAEVRPGEAPAVVLEVQGDCDGRIAESPRGDGGFGYDPVFVDEVSGRTFAEMAPEEKNRLSHRGRALREFRGKFLALGGARRS